MKTKGMVCPSSPDQIRLDAERDEASGGNQCRCFGYEMIHPRIMRFNSGDLAITNTILYFDQQLSFLSCTEIICCFPFFGSLACSLVIRPLITAKP